MHLDVIESLTLAQIVVISSSEQSRSVTSNNGFQVTSMDVEGHTFESVHLEGNLWVLLGQIGRREKLTKNRGERNTQEMGDWKSLKTGVTGAQNVGDQQKRLIGDEIR